jgi:hypothetical protein
MVIKDTKDIVVLDCPHCDSGAFLAWYGGGYYRVRCKNGKCAACGGSSPDPVKAANLWNKRIYTQAQLQGI